MQTYRLKITLHSDTTPGRGDGVAGFVDVEVEHDHHGMPYLRGRSLKGLLVEEWGNLRFALHSAGVDLTRWDDAAYFLFGQPGSTLEAGASMHVGDAQLPMDLQEAIMVDIRQGNYGPTDILESLTAVRNQTAVEPDGTPAEGSLRAMRVILRDTTLEAQLRFSEKPPDDALTLLSACVHAVRRLGTARNRGRGWVELRLFDGDGQPISEEFLEVFAKEVRA
jgi:CRISPR/Cas system CSM-associated protein Csm3 (group 7 of RAMP superfamily)